MNDAAAIAAAGKAFLRKAPARPPRFIRFACGHAEKLFAVPVASLFAVFAACGAHGSSVGAIDGYFPGVTEEQWRKMAGQDLDGTSRVTGAFPPSMLEKGY